MSRKTVFSILLILLFAVQCANKQDASASLDLKRLEYEQARNADLSLWEDLYTHANTDEKIRIICSMAKIKHPDFLPFLETRLKTETDRNLFRKLIFALGQLNGSAGEKALLTLDFETLNNTDKSYYLQILGLCGTDQSVSFLQKILPRREYSSDVLMAAALLARKGVSLRSFHNTLEDTNLVMPPSPQLAYYFSNNFKETNFSSLTPLLASGNDTIRKYTYKTLLKKLNDNTEALQQIAILDTSGYDILKADVRRTLTGKKEVFLQWYALKLVPLVGDSSFIPLLERASKHTNPHIQIASFQAYSTLFREAALAFLMAGLSSVKDEYVKGQIIIEISKISPKTAFPFINNNLGSRNETFIEALLTSLGNISDQIAVSTLRQYLNVPNPRLACAAFGILSEKRKLRSADIEPLLKNDEFCIVSMALDWRQKKKIKTDPALLFSLFEKFSDPGFPDVQLVVAQTLKELNYDIPFQTARMLLTGASHPVVLKELATFLDIPPDSIDFKRPPVPEYLRPDSLLRESYSGAIITTGRGEITLEFFPDAAPLTVRNFITLAGKGFFDGLSFHRSVPDFVIQGGDPLGFGYGGPGYLIPSEDNSLPFVRGSVGMATSGYDTGGSQFYICHSEQPHLDGRYTLFANVTNGIDIADMIVPGDLIKKISLIK